MSVTLVFTRCGDSVYQQFLNDPGSFDEKEHADCESIRLGVEHMAVADLAARASNKKVAVPRAEPLFQVIVGTAGTSAFGNDDYPWVMAVEDVASATAKMGAIGVSDLRECYDLDRLKADYGEIEEWLWDKFGPTVLDDRLIPMFKQIKGFFRRAAQSKQKVVASWF